MKRNLASSVVMVDSFSDKVVNGVVKVVNRQDPSSGYLTDGWVYLIEEVGQEFTAGVEKVMGELFGQYEGLFDELRWYVKAVKVTNLRSILKLEFDLVSKEFSRLSVALNACIKGFNHCQPFLCLHSMLVSKGLTIVDFFNSFER
ncbi:hypothetical protein RHMOL_Rhmol09G0044100 [Rhododendron molle]|uniref:Uncharacterized protein n=1 Tax=Rhododendron molle TaxID=49168 RepID=A0ACC0MAU7_RHOML|nr:hypothetical protein RHMOL_Rhmol09G0044100 [Rhododendron molle]